MKNIYRQLLSTKEQQTLMIFELLYAEDSLSLKDLAAYSGLSPRTVYSEISPRTTSIGSF